MKKRPQASSISIFIIPESLNAYKVSKYTVFLLNKNLFTVFLNGLPYDAANYILQSILRKFI
jgi:hypothetical protein